MEPQENTFRKTIRPEVLEQIRGRDLLIAHLGSWPTFDDFEVLSIHLARQLVLTGTYDLRAEFLVFDLNKAPDDPERRQGIAEFLFESVDHVFINGFNHQNPIFGLSIEPNVADGADRGFFVRWGGTALPHDVSFACRGITVVRVVNLNPFCQSHPKI